MKTNREQIVKKTRGQDSVTSDPNDGQSGNVLIYVLVAVALFAALSFSLMRQTDTSEVNTLSHERAELIATELIASAAQVKSVIDQMQFQGIRIDDMEFMRPGETGYNTEPPSHIYKVYHPEGGGLVHPVLSKEATHQVSSAPPVGWYLGRFNNVEWTKGTDQDVILTAYQIQPEVCRIINKKVTGSDDIPVLAGSMSDFLIDRPSSNDLTHSVCSACNNNFSLCVSNSARTAYSFYTIIADQ